LNIFGLKLRHRLSAALFFYHDLLVGSQLLGNLTDFCSTVNAEPD
jgi:hypothetical protein